MKSHKRIQRIILFLTAGALLMITAGCDVARFFPGESPQPESESRDPAVFEEGLRRFETGDLEKASELFEQVFNETDDWGLRQRALYGLACSRLILAEDDDAMGEAIRFWNIWSQWEPEGLAGADPRMLAPLVQRIIVNGFAEPQIAFSRSEETPEMFRVTDDFPAETVDVFAAFPPEDPCETELEDREKEVRQLEKKLTRMRRQIRKLKRQIESLETIHRTIQEKKREFHYP